MKTIPLTKGLVTTVDDEDFDFLNQWKWYAHKSRDDIFYAARRNHNHGKIQYIFMHRLIMNTPKGVLCDHSNHDTLNNQKYNLRNCTHVENQRNRKAMDGKTSRYLGVYLQKSQRHTKKYGLKVYDKGMWKAQIGDGKKRIHLGSFETEISAALAYNEAAKKYYGEFANLNIINDAA